MSAYKQSFDGHYAARAYPEIGTSSQPLPTPFLILVKSGTASARFLFAFGQCNQRCNMVVFLGRGTTESSLWVPNLWSANLPASCTPM